MERIVKLERLQVDRVGCSKTGLQSGSKVAFANTCQVGILRKLELYPNSSCQISNRLYILVLALVILLRNHKDIKIHLTISTSMYINFTVSITKSPPHIE